LLAANEQYHDKALVTCTHCHMPVLKIVPVFHPISFASRHFLLTTCHISYQHEEIYGYVYSLHT